MGTKGRRAETAHRYVGFTGAAGVLGAVSVCLGFAATPTNARADVIFQIFESRYPNIEHRMPDIFMAGYDALWIPPVGRASSESGNLSVGYDPFNRFDLGVQLAFNFL